MKIEIDGSLGEGGGQILRTSLSLSCMHGVPVRISNIRSGRSAAGLARQHLAVVNALGKISGAKAKGAQLGCTCVEFEPGKIRGGEYEFDIGSAGAVTLLAQAILPVLCNADGESRVVLRGGTHVKGAPFWDYFENVFLGCAGKFGVSVQGKLKQAGFYPKGGGEIELLVKPCTFRSADFLEQGQGKAKCRIYASGLPAHVAQREKDALGLAFGGNAIEIEDIKCKAACPGNAVVIWEDGIGACGLGEIGKKAEDVAKEAASYFLGEKKSGAAIDSHCADQLLLYMGKANGKCSIRTSGISAHLKTNMQVIEKFGAVKFGAKEDRGTFIVTSDVV